MTKRQADYIRKLALRHDVQVQLHKDQYDRYRVQLTRHTYPITVTVTSFQQAQKKVTEIAQYVYNGKYHQIPRNWFSY